MSVVDRQPNESRSTDGSPCPGDPVFDLLPSREVDVAGLAVRRALPRRKRRMIGAWCFVDHFGPAHAQMQVGPHPHIGLQTVTWLVEGEIMHHDSLGVGQPIRPGQLNLMTSGDGISHSEESPTGSAAPLHGVQLWAALPEPERRGEALFEHHAELPVKTVGGFRCTVLVGHALEARSPARVHTPLTGIDLLGNGGEGRIPLDPAHEHGLIVLTGRMRAEGRAVKPGALAYLGRGRDEVRLAADGEVRALLLGGAPFGEDILMWWNFVGRSWDEIASAKADWDTGSPRFGTVASELNRLAAPPLRH